MEKVIGIGWIKLCCRNFNNNDLRIISGGSFEDDEEDVEAEDFIFYTNKLGEKYPNRTYGGNDWYGGFSDHLPIYCRFGLFVNSQLYFLN